MATDRKNVLRDVMVEANAMKAAGLDRATAMRQAWKVVRLAILMAAGTACHFQFEKADGEVRDAYGLPARTGEFLVKGTGRSVPSQNVLYFDVEKQAFRSFAKSRLISVG